MTTTAQEHAAAARRLAERATVEAHDPAGIAAARLAREYAALAATFAEAGDAPNAARFRTWTAAEEQRVRLGGDAAMKKAHQPTLDVTLAGRYRPISVKMYGALEETCAIKIDADPADAAALRRWLENEAVGLFGHMILDGERARPSDVLAAFFNRDAEKRWRPVVHRRPRGTVPGPPPGCVYSPPRIVARRDGDVLIETGVRENPVESRNPTTALGRVIEADGTVGAETPVDSILARGYWTGLILIAPLLTVAGALPWPTVI